MTSGSAVASANASNERPRGRRFFNSLAAIYLVLLVAPWRFSIPQATGDGQYYSAIVHAWTSGWQWGRDIIATYGPLGILYIKPIVEQSLLVTALFWTALALILALNFLDLAKSTPQPLAVVLLLGFALPFTFERPEPVFFTIPLLAAIGCFRVPRPVATWKILLLVAIAGPVALIKLSFGILSLGIFLVLDVDRACRRVLPLHTPVFLGMAFISYLYAGQDPREIFTFIVESADVVSGFSESMQYWGTELELVIFLLATALGGVLFWRFEFRRNLPVRPPARNALYGACFFLFVFVIFKTGFVRQDIHTITSWGALSAATAAYVASVWDRADARRMAACAVGLMVFSCGTAIKIQDDYGYASLWTKMIVDPSRQLTDAVSFTLDPEAWLLREQRRRDAALTVIRRGLPLASVEGSVDCIPSIQTQVLAHGLDYRPRPGIQEYLAYSGRLINANLNFLRSNRAPKYIILGTGSIDGRYPTLADGPLWPELLRLYEPIRSEGRGVLMRRRSTALDAILSQPERVMAHLGQALPTPLWDAVFVSVDLRQTLLGRFVQMLFKPGQISLTVTLADNTTRRFLLIPGVTRRGFVLSPLIENHRALDAFLSDRPDRYPALRVVSFTVEPDGLAKLSYEHSFEVQFRALNTDTLRAGWSGFADASPSRLAEVADGLPPR